MRLCTLAPWLVALVAFAVWARRFAGPFPAHESDYGVHYTVVRELLRGQWWPLPYTGMVGAHTAAALLAGLGLPVPQAMTVVTIASLLLATSAIVLAVKQRTWAGAVLGLGAFALVGLPLISSLIVRGYFAQVAGFGPYCLAIHLATRRFNRARNPVSPGAAAALAVGALCYADGAMWIAPLVFFPGSERLRSPSGLLPFVGALAASAFLFWRQTGLLHLEGGLPHEVRPVFVLFATVVLAGVALTLRRSLDEGAGVLGLQLLLVCYLLLATGEVAVSYARFGSVGYYARKNLYWVAILLPFAASMVRGSQTFALLFVVGGVLLFRQAGALEGEPLRALLVRLVHGDSAFDAEDEACGRRLVRYARDVQHCGGVVFLPGAKYRSDDDGWGDRIVRVEAFNALGGRYSTGAAGLQVGMADTFALARYLREHARWNLSEVGVRAGDCVFVDDRQPGPLDRTRCPEYRPGRSQFGLLKPP